MDWVNVWDVSQEPALGRLRDLLAGTVVDPFFELIALGTVLLSILRRILLFVRHGGHGSESLPHHIVFIFSQLQLASRHSSSWEIERAPHSFLSNAFPDETQATP